MEQVRTVSGMEMQIAFVSSEDPMNGNIPTMEDVHLEKRFIREEVEYEKEIREYVRRTGDGLLVIDKHSCASFVW